jgi:hypothetical protein
VRTSLSWNGPVSVKSENIDDARCALRIFGKDCTVKLTYDPQYVPVQSRAVKSDQSRGIRSAKFVRPLRHLVQLHTYRATLQHLVQLHTHRATLQHLVQLHTHRATLQRLVQLHTHRATLQHLVQLHTHRATLQPEDQRCINIVRSTLLGFRLHVFVTLRGFLLD